MSACRYAQHASNSAWQSERARVLRAWIFEVLGRVCANCGDEAGPHEVNHIWRRTYSVKRLSVYKRTLAYWRDVQAGRCNCLCASCNANWRGRPAEEAPPLGQPCQAFMDWLERQRERNPQARVKVWATCQAA